jgi:hypothetical protein
VADSRSRRAKLEAVIAPSSGATDGERANAQALLERITAAAAEANARFHSRAHPNARWADEQPPEHKAVQDEVDDFLRRWRPGFSNGKRRPRRPIVSVPNRQARGGGVTGTLQFGDALEAGEIVVTDSNHRPIAAAGTPIRELVERWIDLTGVKLTRRFDNDP